VIARSSGYCPVCGDYIVARRKRPSRIRALALPLRPQQVFLGWDDGGLGRVWADTRGSRVNAGRPRVWVHERCWYHGENLLLWQYLAREGLGE
jgi:hypothetical protein